jgi:hypothetical protein
MGGCVWVIGKYYTILCKGLDGTLDFGMGSWNQFQLSSPGFYGTILFRVSILCHAYT